MIYPQKTPQQLTWDHQHKAEWKTLIGQETDSWRALDNQHQQAMLQLRLAKDNWGQQITVLKAQLVEIQCLHQVNQAKRVLLEQRQTRDKNSLFDAP